MDRLPLELKLPPQDAYFKIRQACDPTPTPTPIPTPTLLQDPPGACATLASSLTLTRLNPNPNSSHSPRPSLSTSPRLPPTPTPAPNLLQVIEEVNSLLASVSGGTYPRLSPEEGNVIFASSYMNWSFTLKVRR